MLPPTLFSGLYQNLQPTGRSGVEEYYGRHAQLGYPVLVRAVRHLSAGRTVQGRLFVRGAVAAAKLRHPNVTEVIDHLSTPEADYLVEEEVGGQPVRDILKRDGPFPPARAVAVAAQVADALGYAHQKGLIHRNVSGTAVTLTADGAVKLGGFEAARLPGETDDPWADDPLLGNPVYMSPEQYTGEPVTPASDAYSLGCLLFEMLTGRPPFTGASPDAILYAKTHAATPPRPSKGRKGVPATLDKVVASLLQRNPMKRPGSMAEVKALLGEEGTPAAAAAPDMLSEVLHEFPAPIALAYNQVWAVRDYGRRFDSLLDLAEATVKYSAAVAVLAGCAATGRTAGPMDKLQQPSFGQWLGYLRTAVRGCPADPLVARFAASFDTPGSTARPDWWWPTSWWRRGTGRSTAAGCRGWPTRARSASGCRW